MPTWYRAGTVSVSNGSTAVTGAGGTAWVANANPGDAIHLPDGRAYEVAAITGNAALTLATGYLGPTSAGGDYAIQPTRGQTIEFTTAATALLAAVQGYIDGPLSGKFAAGSAGAPALAKADDTDTGLFWAAANVLGLAAGGSARALLTPSALQLDVPLTGSAVQSGAADATVGRLMKVGAFGLGGTAPSITGSISGDPAALTPGVFGYSNSTASGGPSEVTNGTLINLRRGGTIGAQIMVADWSGAVTGRLYSRAYVAGAWSEWRTPYTKDNIVGTVSRSDAVPTGAVIERDSNANGEYVRFADGTQICFFGAAANVSAGVTWTFPAAFSFTPNGMSVQPSALTSVSGVIESTSAASLAFSAYNASGGRTAQFCRLTAIGRWF